MNNTTRSAKALREQPLKYCLLSLIGSYDRRSTVHGAYYGLDAEVAIPIRSLIKVTLQQRVQVAGHIKGTTLHTSKQILHGTLHKSSRSQNLPCQHGQLSVNSI